MKRQRPERPERAYQGMVVALWPQLGEDDPRQYDMDKAYGEVTTNRTLNLRTRKKTREWEASPREGIGRLLRITCIPQGHFGGNAPMLAEVWNTTYGLLFISRLFGAVFDPEDDPNDRFAPPTAVLSRAGRLERAAAESSVGSAPGYEPVPFTDVRILLDGPVEAKLWVKCADHGPGVVDRLLLNRAYQQDRERRRQRDTLKPTVIRLHDVGALSSTL